MIAGLSALISFLGGGAFRWIMGELMSYFKARQEQESEIERLRVESELEDRRAARQAEAMRLQAELGVQTIRVQAEGDVAVEEARAFAAAQAQAFKSSGVPWVDAWSSAMRPAYATVALVLWIGSIVARQWHLSEWDLAVMGAIVGFFFADRSLRKAGK